MCIRDSLKCLYASFIAPQVTVVTPDECQSNPRTQPKAWNHHGSARRRSISAGPRSSTTAIVTAPASRHIRSNSHGGALPVCRGSCAVARRMGHEVYQEAWVHTASLPGVNG